MSMLGEIALAIALAPLPWISLSTIGWWTRRDSDGRHLPWNWRVLVWPDVYYRWLDRRTNGR